MAKHDRDATLEKARTTYYRIVPAKDATGKLLPEKWHCEEVTLEGVITKRRMHETAQPLAVARERFFSLTRRNANTPEPEKW